MKSGYQGFRGVQQPKKASPVLVARGGLERPNPAKTTTHSGMGVKETHNFMLWEKTKNVKYIRWGQIVFKMVLEVI